jgi:hypothetical protein
MQALICHDSPNYADEIPTSRNLYLIASLRLGSSPVYGDPQAGQAGRMCRDLKAYDALARDTWTPTTITVERV